MIYYNWNCGNIFKKNVNNGKNWVYVVEQVLEARWTQEDRLCGLVVRVPGYTTEMYFVSCEVRTEFLYVM
jgi:hypothetical protein